MKATTTIKPCQPSETSWRLLQQCLRRPTSDCAFYTTITRDFCIPVLREAALATGTSIAVGRSFFPARRTLLRCERWTRKLAGFLRGRDQEELSDGSLYTDGGTEGNPEADGRPDVADGQKLCSTKYMHSFKRINNIRPSASKAMTRIPTPRQCGISIRSTMDDLDGRVLPKPTMVQGHATQSSKSGGGRGPQNHSLLAH
ncbi:hypothetical protein RvY_17586 [Ramazzottius varieornatus]|uniref:Uncharacterized protein n=1 Tax=Ramazzottius varieornatus TaxID=947166 RepID=A0A1D1W2M1_RAMVA|nr:hypothetical protein RvY_17586 [Ramazzottius varieornatus]